MRSPESHAIMPLGTVSSLMLALVAVAAAGVAADEARERTLQPVPQAEVVDSDVYRIAFGDANPTRTREKLQAVLLQKIALVDRVCTLSEIQEKKLRLAGRADIEQLTELVEKIELQIPQFQNDRAGLELRLIKLQLLKRRLNPGFSRDDAMFVKVLDRLLTAEQKERFEPLRFVVDNGGRVQTRLRGTSEQVEFDLTGARISDDDLAQIGRFHSLQRLGLGQTHVTDLGLAHLKHLAALEDLKLGNSLVTDAGLVHIQDLTELQELRLGNTRVADAGLVYLRGLIGLQRLGLDHTRVTDAGLQHLQGLTSLQALALNDTAVTDAGLVHLKGLTALRDLRLGNTRVTDAGIADLIQALPSVRIAR